jgi:hypothetical protein
VPLISGGGVSVELPTGWEGEIDTGGIQSDGARRRVVLHLASFPLPANRSDFGIGAVEMMEGGDVLVVLFEYDPGSAATPLFDRRRPALLEAVDFDRDQLQRRLPGQSGSLRFFTEAGRTFSLYVVVGSHLDRADALPVINQILSTLRIEP